MSSTPAKRFIFCRYVISTSKISRLTIQYQSGNPYSSNATEILRKMRHLKKKSDWNGVLRIYDDYNGRYSDEMNTMALKSCIQGKYYQKGKDIIKQLNINNVNIHKVEFITLLIQFYGDIGDIKKAMIIYREFNSAKDDVMNMAILQGCLKTKEYQIGLNFIKQLNIRDINQCHESFVGVLMNFYVHCGNYGKVASLYEEYRNHNDYTLNMLVKASLHDLNCKYKRTLISNIKLVDYQQHSGELITSLIHYYLKMGNVREALNIYNNSNEKVKRNSVLNLSIIKYCMEFDEINTARLFIDSLNIMEFSKCTPQLITTVINFYVKTNDVGNAIMVYNGYDKELTEFVALSIIKCCMNNNDYNSGVAFISRLNIIDINEYSIEFSTGLIEFYIQNGNTDLGMTLFHQYQGTKDEIFTLSVINSLLLKKEYKKITEIMKDINIDDVNQYSIKFIGTLMNFYIEKGDPKSAIDIYKRYQKPHNDVTKLFYIKACTNNDLFDDGIEFIKQLNIENINDYSIEFVGALMHFYIEYGDLKECIRIYDSYQKHNEILNGLYIKATTNMGNYIKANKLIQSLNVSNVNDYSIELINILINYYCTCRDIETATNIYIRINESIKNISCIATMMNGYKMNKEYQAAIDLFIYEQINRNAIFNEYLCSIALHCCGEMVCHENASIICEYVYCRTDYETPTIISSLIYMYAKLGEFDLAIDTFNDYINLTNNNINNINVYGSILYCYSKMGDIRQVLHHYNSIQNSNHKISDNIHCTVINACSHSGYINKALAIFHQITQSTKMIKPTILVSIIDCLSRGNQCNKAEQIYDKYSNADHIYNSIKLTMLRSILSGCRVYNDIDRAERIFRLIESIYDTDPNVEVNPSDYILLSNIYGKTKNYQNNTNMDDLQKRLNKLKGM